MLSSRIVVGTAGLVLACYALAAPVADIRQTRLDAVELGFGGRRAHATFLLPHMDIWGSSGSSAPRNRRFQYTQRNIILL